MSDRVVIRSFHRVFETDRRIYSIERGPGKPPLPISIVPNGIPLPGIYLFAATEILIILVTIAPGLGTIAELFPPLLRFLILPLTVAVIGLQATTDGRAAPAVALAITGLKARDLTAKALERWHQPRPVRVRVAWDADSPKARACRIHGPATVGVRTPVLYTTRRGKLTGLRGRGHARPAQHVPAGQTLRIR